MKSKIVVDGHDEIGHGTDNERCPVCLARAAATTPAKVCKCDDALTCGFEHCGCPCHARSDIDPPAVTEAAPLEPRLPWPDPTLEMLDSHIFNAIWSVINTWDISVPHAYVGYCGATGNHVRAIIEGLPKPAALRSIPAATSDPGAVMCHCGHRRDDHAGHNMDGRCICKDGKDCGCPLFVGRAAATEPAPAWGSAQELAEAINATLKDRVNKHGVMMDVGAIAARIALSHPRIVSDEMVKAGIVAYRYRYKSGDGLEDVIRSVLEAAESERGPR